MHIPDGFLDISICIITYLVVIIFWALALRKMKKVLSEKHIPLMATLTAMFFAAQMMTFAVSFFLVLWLLPETGPRVAKVDAASRRV